VLAALSTGHEIGLVLSGLAFVVFALISAVVIPRRNPNFPGPNRNWFILLSGVFFIGMLLAVYIFGKSTAPPEKHNNAATAIAARPHSL
jgi:drug/metabolite transporter (DMT)-like permease